MENTAKFLRQIFRYVLPGHVFLLEIYIYSKYTNCILLNLRNSFTRENDIFIIILAGTILGYIFGIIYHAFFYHTTWPQKIKVSWFFPSIDDSRPLIKNAIKKKILIVKHFSEAPSKLLVPEGFNFSKKDAWTITTTLIHEMGADDKRFNDIIIGRLKDFADILHGVGTTCVASFCAMIIIFFYSIHDLILLPFALSTVLSIIFYRICLENSKVVVKHFENFLNCILADSLMKKYEKTGEPYTVHIPKENLSGTPISS